MSLCSFWHPGFLREKNFINEFSCVVLICIQNSGKHEINFDHSLFFCFVLCWCFMSQSTIFLSCWFFGLVWCLYNIPVNSYGHVGMVSSPDHTSWLSTKCTYFACNTDNKPSWISGKEENGLRNYFMIISMGPGWDQTRNPWICSQMRICSQTHNRLRYVARSVMLGFLSSRV